MLNEMKLCFFVSCLNNLVTNPSKRIQKLFDLFVLMSLVHYNISTGNSLFMRFVLHARAFVVICKYVDILTS